MRRTSWIIAASARLYRLLLLAYPPGFRRAYGPSMAQVFRDCCRAAVQRQGAPGLLTVWARTLPDLAASGLRERSAATVPFVSQFLEGSPAMSKQSRVERLAPYPLLLLGGLATGWLNLHTDETPFVALPLLAAAALIGLINPRHAWRWGLLLALALPLSQVWAAAINMQLPYPNTLPGDLAGPLIGGLLFGLAGTYLGVLARWLITQAIHPAPDNPR